MYESFRSKRQNYAYYKSATRTTRPDERLDRFIRMRGIELYWRNFALPLPFVHQSVVRNRAHSIGNFRVRRLGIHWIGLHDAYSSINHVRAMGRSTFVCAHEMCLGFFDDSFYYAYELESQEGLVAAATNMINNFMHVSCLW
jgi:hypothetical protein